MENFVGPVVKEKDQHLQLPSGFRFHPTDEELITHYLSEKVVDNNFFAIAIGEVDMNKVEPWDLPCQNGRKRVVFFFVRDKKYPTGLRTNRATTAGYWKATGKDKEIFRGKSLVGMKKTLVFYKGRAPKGEKTNWVIHEYRLEGRLSLQNLPKTTKNGWVISRVFHKSSAGKNIHISSLKNSESSHVHCFSYEMTNCFNNSPFPTLSNTMEIFPKNSPPNKLDWNQTVPLQGTLSNPIKDPAVLRTLLYDNYGQNMLQNFKKEKEIVSDMNTEISSFEDDKAPSAVFGPQYLDCLWNYRCS